MHQIFEISTNPYRIDILCYIFHKSFSIIYLYINVIHPYKKKRKPLSKSWLTLTQNQGGGPLDDLSQVSFTDLFLSFLMVYNEPKTQLRQDVDEFHH
jgi:hypothetical protein